jgi:4-hydroxy-L-threonine phosphate dehydrogenase PdxA
MKNAPIPIIGLMLGEHAGCGPELAAKVLLARKDNSYTPVLVGNRACFERSRAYVKGAETIKIIDWDGKARPEPLIGYDTYFYNIPAGPDIPLGVSTADGGHLIYNTIKTSVELERAGFLDGLLMCPITKAGLHLAGYRYTSEFELYGELYGVGEAASIVHCDNYYRATVVGHCAFREIIDRLTIERVIATTHRLMEKMRTFIDPKNIRIAIVALNPHGGEGGLFGDEEATILTPAIEKLCSEGLDVVGPWPCDTALNRVRAGEANGIVYLYHDQGNIAQKSSSFASSVLIYVDIPALIVSVSHGPAMDKAGTGEATPKNLLLSLETLIQLAKKKIGS